MVVTNQPTAVSNFIANKTGVSIVVPDPNDPIEIEYQKLQDDDEAAQAEVEKWIHESHAIDEKGRDLSSAALNQRIKTRLDLVRKAYADFLRRHPNHTRARLAYGNFLNETHDEEGAEAQWEKVRKLDPKNPAAWNNLANYYGHFGPVKKAFEYYAKAIELNPLEAVYCQNFATTVFLFRKDAKEFYHIEEQQVFDKALELYSKALKLEPDNFPLAIDVAETYYGIKPPRTAAALAAWEYALKIANDQVEREGVYVHLARIKLGAGRFDEARQHLNAITNEMYTVIKNRLTRNLLEKETKATNAPPAAVDNK